jgi:putative transcriptional regulator
MKLKNYVRMHRARLDLSQEELAKAVGVSRQAIHAVEREKAEPSVTLALKLAKLFGLRVEELFELAEPSGA